MLSPRKEGEEQQPPPGTPDSTCRQNSSLLGSLSKMLWSPSDSSPPGTNPGSPSEGSSFMTQSPRRGEPAIGSRGIVPATPPADVALPQPEKRGLLDTLFSPVFQFFGAKLPDSEPIACEASPSGPCAEGETSAIEATTATSTHATATPEAPCRPPPTRTACIQSQDVPSSSQPSAVKPEQQEEEDLEEFDAYTFIRNLPPYPPPLNRRPICLPKKTRGTHPVSLVLDLDETLLHSSIMPLPTYDIVFTVLFNAVNYQVSLAALRFPPPSQATLQAALRELTSTHIVAPSLVFGKDACSG